ncbi:MAG: primosomal protein N', partial [Erysipelotrichaceae bacterium]
MYLLDVLIEHRSLKLNQVYSYLSELEVQTGIRVRVSFNNQICVAYVMKVQTYTEALEAQCLSRKVSLKPILECIDTESLLNTELSDLGKDMATSTLAPLIACYQAMLPKALNVKSSHASIPMIRYVKVKESDAKLNPQQALIITDIKANDYSYQALVKKYASRINTLYKNGHLEYYQKEQRYQNQDSTLKAGPVLSDGQTKALKHIRLSSKTMICLYGPTGSGKTEIYLQLALDAVKSGKQVLLLVPEIGLTQQMIERVQERFENEVIVYHSHLNDTERYLQYQRVKEDKRAVVIGTRSAIFLPFSHLGLIVLDEEHDHSYKQESSVRYHTRDIAEHRALYHHCSVILGSATPSFETYARALKGVYDLVTLKERIKGKLPSVKIVKPDPRRRKILSLATCEAIQARLDLKQQVLILLNRRGYAPVLQCIDCL